MKTILKIKTICICLISCLSLIFSGCSYTKIENSLRNKIDSEYAPEPATEIVESVSQDKILYYEVGDNIPGYYSYTDEAGNLVENGIKGLNYHINNVEIVESLSSCDFTLDAPEIGADNYFGNNCNNALIVVELTAILDVNAEAPQIVGMDFFADYSFDNDFKEFNPEFPYNCDPIIVYFSDHILDGDINPLTNEEMKESNNYTIFHTLIDSKNPLTFKLAVIASKKLIADKNVFLGEFYQTPPSDEPIYKIDLLGRFK